MHIIIGLIIFVVGIFIVVKSESMLKFFGRIAFFERHLGIEGGSRLGYKLVGIFFIFIGTLVMTNLIGELIGTIFSPLIQHSRSLN